MIHSHRTPSLSAITARQERVVHFHDGAVGGSSSLRVVAPVAAATDGQLVLAVFSGRARLAIEAINLPNRSRVVTVELLFHSHDRPLVLRDIFELLREGPGVMVVVVEVLRLAIRRTDFLSLLVIRGRDALKEGPGLF